MDVDRGLRGEILAMLGLDLDAATEGAPFLSEAVALAEQDTNSESRVRVLCLVAWGRTWALGRVDSDLLERALELAEGSPISTSFAATTYGSLLAMAYENECARDLLSSVRALGPGTDDERLAEALGQLGRVEWAAGNWAHAAELTEEAAQLAGQLGAEHLEQEIIGMQAVVAASRGDVDAARTHGQRSLRLQELTGHPGAHIHGLALLELSLENYEAAHALVLPALVRMARSEVRFPTMKTPIAIEALAHLGRSIEASNRLARFEDEARGADRAWALASVQHCRGLLAAADDDLQEAEALLAAAADRSRELGLPFEHGRSLLALGTVRRRLQQKLAARETLEEARLVLDRLGARIWTARAEAELRRIGGRRNPAGSALSETEAQIAALVSSGHTNSEVAVALQISRKTVEWNLSKIYRKVGVRSRTELAARSSGD